MKLDLIRIENGGELERERVILRATVDVDIGNFAVFRGITTPSNKFGAGNVPSAYWFPDRNVKVGDWVVLYSKAGAPSEKTENNISYFFYWGKTSPIWIKGAIASLIEVGHWSFSEPIK